jgi:4,5-DOPA dioxygenase extradiol
MVNGYSMTQPTIFFGHGSPLNALEDNEFTRKWREVVADIPRPRAILIISAHWLTRGTLITGGSNLETIHDFGGFGPELNNAQYLAKGSPELAVEIASKFGFGIDTERGLDHGAWSVLNQIYPKADIPVLQLSLDVTLSPVEHYNLATKLAYLRDEGVLILGSGNIVHNLGLVDWSGTSTDTWSQEFDNEIVQNILRSSHQNITKYQQYSEPATKSVPTPEHFWPLLYILGVSQPNDKIQIFNQQIVMRSISMTSVKFG